MRYRRLGSTDMNVSVLCLGGWQVGDYQAYDHERREVTSMLRRAVELGVNFFDTAHWYGEGHSEEILGEALAPVREKVYISTKVGLHRIDGVGYRDSRPERIRTHIDGALKRLRTDYVDLYLIHWPDPLVPYEESWAAMCDVLKSGKARYIGVSNYNVEQLQRSLSVGPVHAHQPCYHMLRRHHDEDLLPFCEEHGIGVFPYGPLAHGLLAGRYTPERPPAWPANDWRWSMPIFQGEGYLACARAVQELSQVAKECGFTMAQLAIAWCLQQRGIDSVIAGAYTVEQLDELAGACDRDIPSEAMAKIEEILRRTPSYRDLGGSDDVGGNNIRPS